MKNMKSTIPKNVSPHSNRYSFHICCVYMCVSTLSGNMCRYHSFPYLRNRPKCIHFFLSIMPFYFVFIINEFICYAFCMCVVVGYFTISEKRKKRKKKKNIFIALFPHSKINTQSNPPVVGCPLGVARVILRERNFCVLRRWSE